MRKLWVLLGLLLGIAHAGLGSTALDIPVPVATTSCSFNNSPVDCALSNGIVRMEVSNSFGIAGFGTSDGISTSVSASAWVTSIAPGFSFASAQSTITMDFLGYTEGLVRQGLATFLTVVEADHGGGGNGRGGVSIEGLGGCTYGGSQSCIDRGTLVPFTLGSQFSISLFAFASGPRDGGGSATSQMRLQLFELDGTPVVIYDPQAVPEPGGLMLVVGGLMIILITKRLSVVVPR